MTILQVFCDFWRARLVGTTWERNSRRNSCLYAEFKGDFIHLDLDFDQLFLDVLEWMTPGTQIGLLYTHGPVYVEMLLHSVRRFVAFLVGGSL